MAGAEVVLITGVAGYWGTRLAARLVGNPDIRVIGVDAKPLPGPLAGLEFVMEDLDTPPLAEICKAESVDVICHLDFEEFQRPTEEAFETNVIGTMKLLGACLEAGVDKVIMRSSTSVYGAHPENSAFLTEEHPLRGSRRSGVNRDLLEIENFIHNFRGDMPQVGVTILRFANIVGPTADTPMTRFLRRPHTPSLLGFDPMMQVIHENDVVGALAHAVQSDAVGIFNIAAEGVLPLQQLSAMAGKMSIPLLHPLVYTGDLMRWLELTPLEPDYLRYPWVADLTKMQTIFKFEPTFTAEGALREFAGQQRFQWLSKLVPIGSNVS